MKKRCVQFPERRVRILLSILSRNLFFGPADFTLLARRSQHVGFLDAESVYDKKMGLTFLHMCLLLGRFYFPHVHEKKKPLLQALVRVKGMDTKRGIYYS
jgi:hypothetical protein